MTDKVIVERLGMVWVGHSTTHDEAHTLRVARFLHALSLGIVDLKDWYHNHISQRQPYDADLHGSSHPRFYPFPDRYPIHAEDFREVVEFEYVCPLQKSATCVAFQAVTKGVSNPKRIVVKFVQRYCPELHRTLADSELAPALLYYGRLHPEVDYEPWAMVVMDYLDSEPSFVNNRHQDEEVSNKVLEAITLAHAAGFVLGDVRPPNVLIGREDGKVQLIDFDWGGQVEGEEDEGVRYPAHMSELPIWIKGVGPMKCIQKSHDLAMHKKWFSPDSPPV